VTVTYETVRIESGFVIWRQMRQTRSE
jgi:hypothetical protein